MLYKREVAGSSPAQTTKRSIRLMVRTAGFQPVNRSSILLWTTNLVVYVKQHGGGYITKMPPRQTDWRIDMIQSDCI